MGSEAGQGAQLLLVARGDQRQCLTREAEVELADLAQRLVAPARDPGQVALTLLVHRPIVAREGRAALEQRRLPVHYRRVLDAERLRGLDVTGDELRVGHRRLQ